MVFRRKHLPKQCRSLPICGFTQWAYSSEHCTCRTRIVLLHVTIDDLSLLQQPFIENIDELLESFERTYLHLRVDMPFLFRDHEFYDFLL